MTPLMALDDPGEEDFRRFVMVMDGIVAAGTGLDWGAPPMEGVQNLAPDEAPHETSMYERLYEFDNYILPIFLYFVCNPLVSAELFRHRSLSTILARALVRSLIASQPHLVATSSHGSLAIARHIARARHA